MKKNIAILATIFLFWNNSVHATEESSPHNAATQFIDSVNAIIKENQKDLEEYKSLFSYPVVEKNHFFGKTPFNNAIRGNVVGKEIENLLVRGICASQDQDCENRIVLEALLLEAGLRKFPFEKTRMGELTVMDVSIDQKSQDAYKQLNDRKYSESARTARDATGAYQVKETKELSGDRLTITFAIARLRSAN